MNSALQIEIKRWKSELINYTYFDSARISQELQINNNWAMSGVHQCMNKGKSLVDQPQGPVSGKPFLEAHRAIAILPTSRQTRLFGFLVLVPRRKELSFFAITHVTCRWCSIQFSRLDRRVETTKCFLYGQDLSVVDVVVGNTTVWTSRSVGQF